MDNRGPYAGVEAVGLKVHVDEGWRVGCLRYFERSGEPRGPFAAQFSAWSGTALPAAGRVVALRDPGESGNWMFAWRSPTETWAFSREHAAFDALEARFAASAHGHWVDQSGGLWVLKAAGERVRDLLVRIGSTAALPDPGEAHISRVAELTVLTMCATPGEILLVVDRVYAEHLLGWIRVTAGDFEG